MNKDPLHRVNRLLEEGTAAAKQAVASVVPVRSGLIPELLCLVAHYRGMAEAPRVASIVPFEIEGPLSALQSVPADPPIASREQYHCGRCGKLYRWQTIVMPYLCAAAEQCPACRPRCAECMSSDTIAEHVKLPEIGALAQRPKLALVGGDGP